MPFGPRHPSYAATTIAVIVMAGMGLVARWVRPMIPPAGKNSMAFETSDYLRAGGDQEIQWQKLSQLSLAEARRTNRLVMMVIGDVASRSGRIADQDAFQDRDLVEVIKEYCVPIRVDISETPAWAHAYRPFSRAAEGLDQLFQVVFLGPDGEYLTQGSVTRAVQGVDRRWVQDLINQARDLQRQRRTATPPTNQQAIDLEALDLRVEEPFFGRHTVFLDQSVHPLMGGLIFNDRQSCRPLGWKFMMRNSSEQSFERSLQGFLRSSMVDWLDGGFFREAESASFGDISTDQLATTNASMMSMLAEKYVRDGDPTDKFLALKTAKALNEGFRDESGIYRAYRVGDNGRASRSRRSSFAVRWLRAQFTGDEREILQRELGLRVEDNPQMMVRAKDPAKLARGDFDGLLDRLRLTKKEVPIRYAGANRLDVHGFVTARMLETARLLDSEELKREASQSLDAMSQFLVGVDEVFHLKDGHGEICLRDYLSFSDACLQDYLTFGRPDSFERGMAVLRRGLEIFATDMPGRYDEGKWEFGDPRPQRVLSPSITDDLGESSVAMTVRLAWAYGKLHELKNPSAVLKYRDPLDRIAKTVVSRFASIANRVQHRMSGFFLAAQTCGDDRVIVVVNPESANAASRLKTITRGHLVLPIWDSVQLGGQLRNSGIYIWSGTVTTGPYTPEQLEAALNDD